MKLIHRIIAAILAVMSLASIGQSQDLMGFDRASFGSVVLSQTQAVGTDIQLELSVGSYENEPISNYSEGSIFAIIGAIMFAVYLILTRYVSKLDSAVTSFFWTGIGGTVTMTIISFFIWEPIPQKDFLWLYSQIHRWIARKEQQKLKKYID